MPLNYQGGKKNIGKFLWIFMTEYEKKYNILNGFEPNYKRTYFEPFCGMCSVGKYFTDRKLILNDINENVMCFLDGVIHHGYSPSKLSITKDEYTILKNTPEISPEKTFYGFSASYRGKWFGGYNKYNDDITSLRKSSILTDSEYIEDFKKKIKSENVELYNKQYDDVIEPHGMIIYCDPPYQSSLGKFSRGHLLNRFDHDKFWNIVRRWSSDNIVFTSETKSPTDFECVWERHTISCLNRSPKVERMYIYNPF